VIQKCAVEIGEDDNLPSGGHGLFSCSGIRETFTLGVPVELLRAMTVAILSDGIAAVSVRNVATARARS
jgi:hypothetical protein